MAKMHVKLKVNGREVEALAEPRTLLIHFLREQLALTGPHIGCDTSHCGACTVDLDERSVKSCTVFVAQANGGSITTIEGIANPDGSLHALQEAFKEHHGLQCGFCTPGMIMAAVDMVHRKGHKLDEDTIREQLAGNFCRCTGYHNIVRAVAAGAAAMGASQIGRAA